MSTNISLDQLNYIDHEKFNDLNFISSIDIPECFKNECLDAKINQALHEISITNQSTSKCVVLSKKEIDKLFIKYNYLRKQLATSHDKECFYQQVKLFENVLLLSNFNLLMSLYRRKIKKVGYLEDSDMISEMLLVMIKSIRSFDVSKGYYFSTFACNAMKNHVYNLSRLFKAEKRSGKFVQIKDKEDESSLTSDDVFVSNENQFKFENIMLSEIDFTQFNKREFSILFMKLVYGMDSPTHMSKKMGIHKYSIQQSENKIIEKIRTQLNITLQ